MTFEANSVKHERAKVTRLRAATYVNDHDAHPYLRAFHACAFHIDVVPEVAKGGARDLCCRNRGADRGTRRDKVDRSIRQRARPPPPPTEHATYLAGILRGVSARTLRSIQKVRVPCKRMPRSHSSNETLECGMPSCGTVGRL